MTYLYRVPQLATTCLMIASAATACVGSGRGVPLYSNDGAPRALAEVAQIFGEIAAVDGTPVSSGSNSFEVLPGCHVVATRTSWGKTEQKEGTSGNMPKLVFAIHMQANHSYVFVQEMPHRTGSGAGISLNVYEKDAAGNVTATLLPASTQEELDRCRPFKK